jgi:hypothetical protein
MHNINTTDPRYIKGIDCNPTKQKKIIFEGSSLKIISGSQVLDSVDLSGFSHFASEFGGSMKKRVFIPSLQNYYLYAGNIGQDQGEVSLIVMKVRYDSSLAEEEKYITWEYEGYVFPVKNLLFLSGRTLDIIKHHGWDLEAYDDTATSPVFTPTLNPVLTEQDLTFGGILIYNRTGKEVEVEILVMN